MFAKTIKVKNPGLLSSYEKLKYKETILDEIIERANDNMDKFFKQEIMHGDKLTFGFNDKFEIDFK